MKSEATINQAAALLRRLGLSTTTTSATQLQVAIPGTKEDVQVVVQRGAGGRVSWATIRAKGSPTRTVFPTKVETDLPRVLAVNIVTSVLDAISGPSPAATPAARPARPARVAETVR